MNGCISVFTKFEREREGRTGVRASMVGRGGRHCYLVKKCTSNRKMEAKKKYLPLGLTRQFLTHASIVFSTDFVYVYDSRELRVTAGRF